MHVTWSDWTRGWPRDRVNWRGKNEKRSENLVDLTSIVLKKRQIGKFKSLRDSWFLTPNIVFVKHDKHHPDIHTCQSRHSYRTSHQVYLTENTTTCLFSSSNNCYTNSNGLLIKYSRYTNHWYDTIWLCVNYASRNVLLSHSLTISRHAHVQFNHNIQLYSPDKTFRRETIGRAGRG